MVKNTYTLKEIIFGLKNEYLQITEKLNLLKQYLQINEQDYENIEILLSKSTNNSEIQIVLFLYERKNKIEKALEMIMKKLGKFPHAKTDYIKEINNRFILQNNPEILINDKYEEFNQSILNIYNSNFVKNIKLIYSGTGYGDIPFLNIVANHIYASKENIAINYTPSKGNYLSVASFKGNLTEEKIKQSLNIAFPKSIFPQYYQHIIETSTSMEKEIDVVGKFNYSKEVNFEIIEEPKKLILKKK